MWYYLAKQASGYRPSYTKHIKTKDLTYGLVDKMYKDHINGISIDEISRQYGYDSNLLKQRFKEKGYKTLPTSIDSYIIKAKNLLEKNSPICKNILNLYNSGNSIQRISIIPGIELPTRAIKYILKEMQNKNKMKPQNPVSIKIQEKDIMYAVDLFRQNRTFQFISTKTGISPQGLIPLIIKNITFKEKQEYRNKILAKNGPELKEKIDAILAYRKRNPLVLNKAKIAKDLGMHDHQVVQIWGVFIDD